MTTWPSVAEPRSLKSHLSTTKGPWRLPKPVLAYHGDLNVMQKNWKPSACNIQMSRGAGIELRIHSFNTSQSRYLAWPGDTLESKEETCVRVRAHGLTYQPSTDWSDWVTVETGLIQPKDWQRVLSIASRQNLGKGKPKSLLYLRKNFDLNTKLTHIQKARLYITALGLYGAEINGERVEDHVLAPGFQFFKHLHVYDTYDATEPVSRDRNAIGILVSQGWYAGRLFGHIEKRDFRNLYGFRIGAMCLLKVTLSDRTNVHIPSDKTWKESVMTGWSTASFYNGDWLSVEELPPLTAALVLSDGPPVRKLKELQPKEIFQSVSGKVIVDFGHNFAGCARITVSGPSGTDIILRNAEVLENGEIETKPPRTTDVPARKFENLDLHFTASAMLRLTTGP
ncbi:hypothetical protein BFJ65_g13287 [Fusarium oxysporum f. sp. cepae]|uniref:Alpha-L-rhamnosidase n=1 Tax=Fusarium oxysporum f. sp. cepae TaxID=396571 RepID=A0A3L6N1R0_FUSOX|nr:hypothetical protein BFJ65_g13287 [Fusarium oxysporum f. sp. cepae]